MRLGLAVLFLAGMVAPGLAPVYAQAPAPAPIARPVNPVAPLTPTAPARPTRTRSHAPVPAETGPALVDINSADAKALDALPGIGPVRAQAIVAGRPYTEKNELVARKIIPANVFSGIEDMIALVNINTASAADMAKILPNVGLVRAAAIVKNRPYVSAQEMVAKGALTQGVLSGIKPMVTAQ